MEGVGIVAFRLANDGALEISDERIVSIPPRSKTAILWESILSFLALHARTIAGAAPDGRAHRER